MGGWAVIDNIVIFGYLVLVLGIGLWSGRKVRDMEEFAVAGRSFTSLVIFATLSASFIGGGFSTGNAEQVFRFGIVNIVALWGFRRRAVGPRSGRRWNRHISLCRGQV
jgi:solute:Na+ symporter, SSS family